MLFTGKCIPSSLPCLRRYVTDCLLLSSQALLLYHHVPMYRPRNLVSQCHDIVSHLTLMCYVAHPTRTPFQRTRQVVFAITTPTEEQHIVKKTWIRVR